MKKSSSSITFFSVVVLLASLFFSLFLFYSTGTDDVVIWLQWMMDISSGGIIETFKSYKEPYPPLSFTLVGLAAWVSDILDISHFFALKALLFIFLILTSLSFYLATRSLTAAALSLLALTVSAVGLGYLDILYAPFLVLSLLALREEKIVLFSILITISFLIKWQPVIIVPFLFVYLLSTPPGAKEPGTDPIRLLLALIPFAALMGLMVIVFGVSVITSLVETGKGGHLSGYAMNFSWFLTYLLHLTDPAAYGPITTIGRVKIIYLRDVPNLVTLLPRLFAMGLYAIAFFSFARRAKDFELLVKYSIIGFLSYFTFYTGAHENHLFTAVVIASVLYAAKPARLKWFLVWGAALNLNLLLFYGVSGRGPEAYRIVFGFDTTVFFALLNVLLFFIFYIATVFGSGADLEGSDAGKAGAFEMRYR